MGQQGFKCLGGKCEWFDMIGGCCVIPDFMTQIARSLPVIERALQDFYDIRQKIENFFDWETGEKLKGLLSKLEQKLDEE